ncbi:MAG TPA: hypothetical protein PLD08_00195 [Acetomicrobium flavidum]|uniref:POTRA domain-containing protein n=1 Tax=Acetomicrobium flavidum TaxID=49896 RepID=A0ABY1JAV9_9BACT|nr:hypothetical protein SAMN05444368_0241 [Acetomicrobium flavidum]HPU68101.1 hypothetical protein [Acetomicrobium flavidum]
MKGEKAAKIKVAFLLMMATSFVLGFLYGIEERIYLFRLKNIDVVPNNVLIEREAANWTGRAARFWPLLFTSFSSWKSDIEARYPVSVSVKVNGWGKITIEWIHLQPSFIVKWHGIRWFITSNGMAWSEKNPLWESINADVRGMLTLKWDDSMPPLVPNESDLLGVRQSIFPVKSIVEFVEAVRNTPWVQSLNDIKLMRVAGELMVMITVASMGKDVNILLEFSKITWTNLSPALEAIVKSTDANRIFLDATYKDKIVIKTK